MTSAPSSEFLQRRMGARYFNVVNPDAANGIRILLRAGYLDVGPSFSFNKRSNFINPRKWQSNQAQVGVAAAMVSALSTSLPAEAFDITQIPYGNLLLSDTDPPMFDDRVKLFTRIRASISLQIAMI